CRDSTLSLHSFPTRRSSDLSLIGSYSGLSGTSQQIGPFEGNTIFYWRVDATNNFGTGSWSTARSFTTGPAPVPAAPTLTQPPNGDRKSTRLNSSHEWISYAV